VPVTSRLEQNFDVVDGIDLNPHKAASSTVPHLINLSLETLLTVKDKRSVNLEKIQKNKVRSRRITEKTN
jgi:hypothetical protein